MSRPGFAPLPSLWDDVIEGYSLHQAAAGLRAETIYLRRAQLSHMARGLGIPLGAVTADALVGWFGRQSWAPETRRSYRNTARGFFLWAYRADRMSADLSEALPSVRQLPAAPRPVPDDVWRDALLRADGRTRLAMRLSAEAGLRRAEVAKVHTRDVVTNAGGAQLVVHGKGGKLRIVPITDSLADALRAGPAGHTPGAATSGYLFPSQRGEHLTPRAVGTLVTAVLPEGFSAHKLRHRFATRAYRGSRNLRAVQTLLGHTSVATTERYTAVDDDEVRAAMLAATM